MNRRRFFILFILVLIQISVIFGVVLAMRLQYPETDEGEAPLFFEFTPTWTALILQYTPTSTLIQELAIFEIKPCTYSSEYLLNHLDELETLSIDIWIGEQEYSTAEAIDFINHSENQVIKDLFLAVYTAKVNIRLGADGSSIDLDLYRADTVISNFSSEGTMTIEEIERAVKLTNTLRDFNLGLFGHGLCTAVAFGVEPSPTVVKISLSTLTASPTATEISSPTLTPTPTATRTNTPSFATARPSLTPTYTKEPDEPQKTPDEPPTSTPFNTRVPPTQPPPTDPPDPPTETPEPTPTIRPTDEPTPTLSGP